jgi:hypothetical protein
MQQSMNRSYKIGFWKGGGGDFMEDWVEQLHQFGKDNDVITRNMRDKVERYVNMTRWEKMNINPEVMMIKAEVKEASK